MKYDLIGQRFGRLVALQPTAKRTASGRLRTFWECKCDCGARHSVVRDALISGDAMSCGCLQKELARGRRTTHGASSSRLYRIWSGMIERCTQQKNPAFHNYGGRGITVCDRWKSSFAAFASDVGNPPTERHSIDRENNDGNYEPGNVRWATDYEQCRNRRGLRMVEWRGREMCLADAAHDAGLAKRLVWQRIVKLGWSPHEALTRPPIVGQKVRGRKKVSGEVVPR